MNQTYQLFFFFFYWSLNETLLNHLSFSFIYTCITIYSHKQQYSPTDIFTKKKQSFELIHWNGQFELIL